MNQMIKTPGFTAESALRGMNPVYAGHPENGATPSRGVHPQGFGCPLSAGACDEHCRAVGFRGGYCKGFFRQTCQCFR